MHLTGIFGVCLAVLAGTTAAMPYVAGPYHGHRIAVQVPTNSTGAHNATSTGTRGSAPLSTGIVSSKNGMKHRPSHGLNSVQKEGKGADHCNELCSLEAQTCNIATPDDDKFWYVTPLIYLIVRRKEALTFVFSWNVYNRCIHNCRPDDFQ